MKLSRVLKYSEKSYLIWLMLFNYNYMNGRKVLWRREVTDFFKHESRE